MVKCTRQVQTRHIFVRTISNFAKQMSNVDIIIFCKNKWKSGSDCHCDVIFYWKITKLVVKCTRQVQTRHIFVRTTSNFAKQISNVDIIDVCKKKLKSDSDCHCDVTFDSKMTKLVLKCTRQVQTRDLFVGITSNFANQISNFDIIDFYKKNLKIGFWLPMWRHFWL